MSASKFDRSLDDLDEAIRMQRLVTHMAGEAVNRLLQTAFRDEKVVERFANQVRMRGPARALAIAEGRDALPRSLWFGPIRGGFLNREERIQAEAALAELPEAFAALLRHQDQLRDLERTRGNVLRERDQAATRERIAAHDRQRQDQPETLEQSRQRSRTRT